MSKKRVITSISSRISTASRHELNVVPQNFSQYGDNLMIEGARGKEVITDFFAHKPSGQFIYVPTREMWVPAGVNASFAPIPVVKDGKPVLKKNGEPKTISPAAWLGRNRYVQALTWVPGEEMTVHDRLMVKGGWIKAEGKACFNMYLPPPELAGGDPKKAGPWLKHVRKIYPDEADHIIMWCAHRVQRPQEKINHALVLGGFQGIGKDTLMHPVKVTVGSWNCHEVSPKQVIGRFNPFLQSIILRVSEARDLGEVSRYEFYDAMKAYTAEPPEELRVDEKNLRCYYILNCCGVVITTNYKTDGIYLPPDDRRHFLAWSERTKAHFTTAHCKRPDR